MSSFGLNGLKDLLRSGRYVLRRTFPALHAKIVLPPPGGFQPYHHTLPNRYPWLFEFARKQLGTSAALRLLSFGCSRGDEVFALRSYFPAAQIRGLDIAPVNVAASIERARAERSVGITFDTAATTQREPAQYYDAIFCLAVLCHGDLTTFALRRCDPLLSFERFEAMVTDFARCLKPGGLLFLHTTNFRFRDTQVSQEFEPILEADPAHMAPDVQFDRHNRLLKGERYRMVGFRKRAG